MKKIAFSVLATSALATMIAVGDAEASTSYTVKPGDSLWKIAAANGTSVSQIKELNSLQTDIIYPNQYLLLSSTEAPKPAPSQPVTPTNTTTYTVKSGDTLSKIALQFKTSVSSIQQLNNISSHMIHPGQVLKISGSAPAPSTPVAPAPTPVPAATSTYTVKSGDTLGKIALLYKTTVTNIQKLNNLSTHIIQIGQVLKISGTVQAEPVVPDPTPSVPANPANLVYTIVTGDTLSGIAYRHRVTVDQIMKWNNLTSTMIRVGQKLTIGGSGEVAPISAPAPVPAPATPVAPGSSIYDKVISLAKPLQGIPYVWGGSSTAGFDCSGFIYYVYKQAGLDVSRTNTTGFDARSYEVSNPVPGDLVFFSDTYRPGISHMGIYLGNNQFIHAGGDRVQITSLSNSYWNSKFTSFKRLYAAD
ncbi:LysM peptidoglycan-binding domain-containing protein [Paenisporosarcina sp. TG20]|uniref:C40 family peptidase n=1 Tax=Paenisporosarcina sp. TG20 TaxID=1211706 RepID=UPI00031DA5BE|nr:peptidoglycan endopeptidase [Paenisporosarcina sp. TG20]